MNSSDSAEEVVKLSLEGMEVAFKIAGAGAKNIAVMIYTIMQDNKQTKSKMNLTNILKTGKPLKIFTVRAEDLATFSKEAKKYGVRYCALTDKKGSKIDGIVDIMVLEEDAPKINRIVQRFNFKSVDDINEEINQNKDSITLIPDKTEDEQFIDDILPKPKTEKIEDTPSNDKDETVEKNQSEIFSNIKQDDKATNSKEDIIDKQDKKNEEKNSVIQELKEIEKELKEKDEQEKVLDDVNIETNGAKKIETDKNKDKENYKKGKYYKYPKHLDTSKKHRRKKGRRERS